MSISIDTSDKITWSDKLDKGVGLIKKIIAPRSSFPWQPESRKLRQSGVWQRGGGGAP